MLADNEKKKEIKQLAIIVLLIMLAAVYSIALSYYSKYKKGYSIIGTSELQSVSVSPENEYYLGIYINHSDITNSDRYAVYLLNNYTYKYCVYYEPVEKGLELEWIDHDTVSINDNIIELSEYEMIFIE